MKKLLILLFVTGLFLFLPLVSRAQIEKIDNFKVDVVIDQNGSFTVTEEITYDFGVLQRHGIYRDIPYKYKRTGTNYNLRIKVLSVTDDKGISWPYQITKAGGYLKIKIGDKDKYVTGQQNYYLVYKVERAINYFDEHDELYWNVTGTEWEVPIEKSQATVYLPKEIEKSQLQKACYTGIFGSQKSNCQSEIIDGETLSFTANNKLSSGEGLTIVLGWPKGIVNKPTTGQNILWMLTDNWFFTTPFLVFIVLLYFWYTAGRDPRGRGTIIPQYEPPEKLPPGAMGVVLDEKADLKDISSTIIDLAVNGYLKIREVEKKKLLGKSTDYEFIQLKEEDKDLTDYEKKIYRGIFDVGKEVKLSDLKDNFYVNLKKIKDDLYNLVVKKGYFPFNPDKVRSAYLVVGIVVIMLSIFAGIVMQVILAGISVFISGMIIVIFSRFMPRRTQRGAETLEEILGFKTFLSVTEKERLKFHNAPEKKPEQFEKFLPYAMVLGVEKEWARQFEGIYNTPPSWYEGHYSGVFTAAFLISSLNSMTANVDSTVVSRPGGGAGGGSSGFGGGGFSGGGFGGGGGGSW